MPVHDGAAGEVRPGEVHDADAFARRQGQEGALGREGGVGAVAEGEAVRAVFEAGGEGLQAGGAEVREGWVGVDAGFEGGEEGVFVV